MIDCMETSMRLCTAEGVGSIDRSEIGRVVSAASPREARDRSSRPVRALSGGRIVDLYFRIALGTSRGRSGTRSPSRPAFASASRVGRPSHRPGGDSVPPRLQDPIGSRALRASSLILQHEGPTTMGQAIRESRIFRPVLNDKLEDRTVPGHLLGGLGTSRVLVLIGEFASRGERVLDGAFGLGGDLGLRGGRGLGDLNLPGRGEASASTLKQDARLVNQAFQTFDASYSSAVAALRQTATSTTGPTQAGLTAYNTAVATAISKLNSSIGSDLSNLSSTGSGLITTIDGYTSTLQTE